MSWLPDEYARKAWLSPVILLVLPVALVVVSVTGVTVVDTTQALGKVIASGTLASLIVASLVMLAKQVGRAGRKQQDYLWHLWGGPSLNNAICGRGTEDHRATWARIRGYLAEQIGIDDADEASDPRSRDLESELKNLTRDHQVFPMVFQENCNYGFRRNLYGLKRWGVATSLVAVAVGALLLLAEWGNPVWPVLPWATLVVGLLALVGWWYVTPMFVRQAAMAYVVAMRNAGVELIRQDRDSGPSNKPPTEDAA